MSKAQRYEIRWDEDTRILAERAAYAAGYTSINAYITHLILQDAPRVLSQYAELKVTSENFERFMAAYQNPPKVGSKLQDVAKSMAKDGIWIETKS